MTNCTTALMSVPVNTINIPLLKDPDITPGSSLDLDSDGRRDAKEMPLNELNGLQHGDVNLKGYLKHPEAVILKVSPALPSSNIASAPPVALMPDDQSQRPVNR